MSMNDEEDLKRKAADAQKTRAEAQEQARRDANSATNKIEQNQAMAQQKQIATSNPKSYAAQQQQQQYRGAGGLGGASAKPGEISALWWIPGMGL